eukprot:2104566-Pyramimonas_sp.AAC.1
MALSAGRLCVQLWRRTMLGVACSSASPSRPIAGASMAVFARVLIAPLRDAVATARCRIHAAINP